MSVTQEKLPHAGLRKAAILVASLDRTSADALLKQLDPQQARCVRRMAVRIERIDPKEQRRVIDEFFRNGSAGPRSSGCASSGRASSGRGSSGCGPVKPQRQPAGIELDDRLARKLLMPDGHAAEAPQPGPLEPDPRPFRFLHEAQAEKLARVMENERPQTIALVLSHLPPDRSARVLARLQGTLQADVIGRLVDLEETDPAILREVERALESRLSQQVRMQRRRVAGMKAVEDILAASDGRTALQILDNLAAADPTLAERLGPQTRNLDNHPKSGHPKFDDLRFDDLRFDDLARLDDEALSTVFGSVEPELALTALVGATPELIDRILRRLPPAQAQTIRHKLDHPGPIRLSDVEDAGRRIANLASRLRLRNNQQLTTAHDHHHPSH